MESKNQADSSKKAASAPELAAQRNANSAQAAEESGKKTSLSFIIGATVAVGVGAYFLLNGLKPITGEEEAAKTVVTEDQVFEADIDAPGVFASADGSDPTPAAGASAAAVDQENLTLADAAETEVSEVPIVFEGDPAPTQTASASTSTSSAMTANLVEGSEVPIEFDSEPLPALAETSAEASEAEATELAMASEAEDTIEESASDEPVSAPPPAAPAPEPEPESQPEPKTEPKPEPASTEAESPDAPSAVATTTPAPEPGTTPSAPAPRAAPPARRAVSPVPVRNRPPPPNLYTKWWPAAESEKLNVLFVGPAQFGTAIAILTDGPFADAASANEQITVRNLTGGKASGSWKVADGNDRMLVFETDKGPYSVKISDKLADKDGRSFSRQASGNVLVK